MGQHLSVHTRIPGRAVVHFRDDRGLVITALGREDGAAGFRIEIAAWGEGAPPREAVVTVKAADEDGAIRKACGAALLFYDEAEAWPP